MSVEKGARKREARDQSTKPAAGTAGRKGKRGKQRREIDRYEPFADISSIFRLRRVRLHALRLRRRHAFNVIPPTSPRAAPPPTSAPRDHALSAPKPAHYGNRTAPVAPFSCIEISRIF